MGPGQKFLTRVGSGQFLVAWVGTSWVSHLWFGFGFGNFPLKISNFSIFCPSGSKKMSSAWVKKYPGQSGVGLLFTPDQKHARVGSGPISGLDWSIIRKVTLKLL